MDLCFFLIVILNSHLFTLIFCVALLQEKRLLDLPKLLDICAIYGHENEDLTRILVSKHEKLQQAALILCKCYNPFTIFILGIIVLFFFQKEKNKNSAFIIFFLLIKGSSEFLFCRKLWLLLSFLVAQNRTPRFWLYISLKFYERTRYLQTYLFKFFYALNKFLWLYLSLSNSYPCLFQVGNALIAQPRIHDNMNFLMSHFLNIIHTMHQR